MNREVVSINHIVFPGKNPDLKKVEAYLKENLRHKYVVEESGDILRIGSKFASEYCGSNYTKSLRGAMLKAKANAATILPKLIQSAHGRRWVDNKNEKHTRELMTRVSFYMI